MFFTAWAVSIIGITSIVVVGGLGRVVAAGVDRGTHRPPRAVAEREVLARGHQRLGFRARVDHRADDAVGAGVEDLHDPGGVTPGHARQRHHAGGRDALQHAHGHLVVHDAVLHVDRQRVEPLVRHHLGGEPARDGQPAVHHRVALRPDLLQLVCPHGRTPLAGAQFIQAHGTADYTRSGRAPPVWRRVAGGPRWANAGRHGGTSLCPPHHDTPTASWMTTAAAVTPSAPSVERSELLSAKAAV